MPPGSARNWIAVRLTKKTKPQIMKINFKAILIVVAFTAAMTPHRANGSPGDLYVTDDVAVYKFAPDGTRTVFASLFRPRGLGFDHFGNLFVSTIDTAHRDNQGRILKFAPDGTFTVFLTG